MPEYWEKNFDFEEEFEGMYMEFAGIYGHNFGEGSGPFDIEVLFSYTAEEGQEWIEDKGDEMCDILGFYFIEIGMHNQEKDPSDY